MALGTDYQQQGCYLARALEVVGERWTLLIVRDFFYGVRHFGELLNHLDVSRGILSERLDTLVEAGVITRTPHGRTVEYRLTQAGIELWPVIFQLSHWGEKHTPSDHPTRFYSHADCGTDVDESGRCPRCQIVPEVADLIVRLGAGENPREREDPVAVELREPHRMLTPFGATSK